MVCDRLNFLRLGYVSLAFSFRASREEERRARQEGRGGGRTRSRKEGESDARSDASEDRLGGGRSDRRFRAGVSAEKKGRAGKDALSQELFSRVDAYVSELGALALGASAFANLAKVWPNSLPNVTALAASSGEGRRRDRNVLQTIQTTVAFASPVISRRDARLHDKVELQRWWAKAMVAASVPLPAPCCSFCVVLPAVLFCFDLFCDSFYFGAFRALSEWPRVWSAGPEARCRPNASTSAQVALSLPSLVVGGSVS